MTSIPSKLGLILIGVYWSAMAGLTIYALNTEVHSPIETTINRSVTRT